MDRYKLVIDFKDSVIIQPFNCMKSLEKMTIGLIDNSVYSAKIIDNVTGKNVRWLKLPPK